MSSISRYLTFTPLNSELDNFNLNLGLKLA